MSIALIVVACGAVSFWALTRVEGSRRRRLRAAMASIKRESEKGVDFFVWIDKAKATRPAVMVAIAAAFASIAVLLGPSIFALLPLVPVLAIVGVFYLNFRLKKNLYAVGQVGIEFHRITKSGPMRRSSLEWSQIIVGGHLGSGDASFTEDLILTDGKGMKVVLGRYMVNFENLCATIVAKIPKERYLSPNVLAEAEGYGRRAKGPARTLEAEENL
ncbi:MAG: hypothetical protein LUO79_01475 [Methanomassiliicoccales archaeon]|nr:hypothetical protein [Methanomassiliicoccales archaeon]